MHKEAKNWRCWAVGKLAGDGEDGGVAAHDCKASQRGEAAEQEADGHGTPQRAADGVGRTAGRGHRCWSAAAVGGDGEGVNMGRAGSAPQSATLRMVEGRWGSGTGGRGMAGSRRRGRRWEEGGARRSRGLRATRLGVSPEMREERGGPFNGGWVWERTVVAGGRGERVAGGLLAGDVGGGGEGVEGMAVAEWVLGRNGGGAGGEECVLPEKKKGGFVR